MFDFAAPTAITRRSLAFFLQPALYVSLLPQKRTLLTAMHVAEGICAPVPHRQVVLTISKRLRLHTRFDRNLTPIAPNIDAEREFQAVMAAWNSLPLEFTISSL